MADSLNWRSGSKPNVPSVQNAQTWSDPSTWRSWNKGSTQQAPSPENKKISHDWRSRKNEDMLLGTVKALHQDFGFIVPDEPLLSSYEVSDVYFSTKYPRDIDLAVGDKVRFLLNNLSKEKPQALKVLKCDGSGGNIASNIRDRQVDPSSPACSGQNGALKLAQRNEGKVIKVFEDGTGSIRITGDLPDQCKEYRDTLYFDSKWVECGGIKISVGDKVEFDVSLNKRHANQFSAHRIKLIECRPKNDAEISQVITEMIDNIRDDSNDNSGIILQMLRCDALWESIGSCLSLLPKTITRLLDLLEMLSNQSKASTHIFKHTLEVLLSTELCTHKSHRSCFRQFVKGAWENNEISLQAQIKKFLLMVLDYLPNKVRLIATLAKCMLSMEEDSTEHFLFMVLKKVGSADDIEGFEWDELPLVPTTRELLQGFTLFSEYMNQVRTQGPYESVQDYMDTYFRLLREDCFSSLRTGVQKYLNNTLDPRDMSMYTGISLSRICLTAYGGGVALGIKVTPCNMIDDWRTCRNLQFGNLLCLSPSGSFTDPIWATVSEKDPELLETDSIIWVKLVSDSNYLNDTECISALKESRGRTIMAESPTYYIAYQPVLKTLQNTDAETLAFQAELVNMEAPCAPENLDEQSIEPSSELDESQALAFTQALLNRLSIIQGPPGTGKTFIGIHLIKHFLRQEAEVKFPILVLTYKNHALDEFTKSVLQFLPNGVARVGGRSEDPELVVCNLKTLKGSHSMPKKLASERHAIQNDVFALKAKVRILMEKFEAATHFSAETVLRTFNLIQIERFLWGFRGKHSWTVAEAKGIKDALIKYEDLLNDTEKPKEELISNLDEELVMFVDQALKEWLPPSETFENIMKVEEGPTYLKAQQSEAEVEVDSEHTPSEIDETDVAEEEQERLLSAAFFYPWEYDKSQDEIRVKEQNTRVPYLGSVAKRWAAGITWPYLTQIDDLWSLSEYDRVFIIQAILWHQKDKIERELKDAMEKYKQLLLVREEIEQQRKVSVLEGKKVIAMTITGASIHHRLLQSLKPAVIIVEEAAEVLEPQLMAVLGNWVQHMILIGDHKQLRPSVDSYILARDYHLDVSMMERLVNNNYPYATLQMQSRMLPEMAELLTDIYPELQSNEDQVIDNHPPDFLPTMFFWTHEDEETEDRSFSNEREASRVISLALFFLMQGYKIEDITILAAYRGQLKLLRQMLKEAQRDHPSIFPSWCGSNSTNSSTADANMNIKVHTIDMYQGDENKIVIVSLVRSNKDGQIGFLKTINRRCVAQSRARCGMYFVGNATTFLEAKGSCWKSVIVKMDAMNLVGKKLPLHCRYHSQVSKVEAETAELIPLMGICKLPCELKMDCGKHECAKSCQPFHNHKCHEIVKFVHDDCQHPGLRECWETESEVVCKAPCEEMMLCGLHTCASPCQPEHSHVKELCKATVEHTFSDCGHVTTKQCGELEGMLRCTKSCWKMMGCGIHWCYSNCKPAHSHLASACKEQVSYKFPECGHKTKKKCGQDQSKLLCSAPCKRLMECGLHQCPIKCQPKHSHEKAVCSTPVAHKLTACGHQIVRQCREDENVIFCQEPCARLMDCGVHKCPSKCQPDHLHLKSDCTVPTQHKLQSCGHWIEKKCGEDESAVKCKKRLFAKLQKCPHYITIKCCQSNDFFRCESPCIRKLFCGHPCEGLCGNTCDASCRICEQRDEIDRKNKLVAEEKEREKAREKAHQELADLVANNPYLLTRCHLQLLLPEGDTASEYIDVCDRVQRYVQPKHNWFPEVSRIEKITNLKLYERWLQAKSDMFDPTRVELKFHGADEKGVENIIGHGFRLPETAGMYGSGFYFATDSSKSAQSRDTQNSNKLLLCNVLLGKSLTVDSAKPSMKRETLRDMGYDSLYARRKTEENGVGSMVFDEYVVYNPAQALPKYIIHYGQSTLENMNLKMSAPSTFEEQNLTPKRQYDPSDPLDFHFRLAESQFLRLTKYHHITAEVKSVDFYQNPLLIKRFNEKEKKLKAKYPGGNECKPILAFHGTPVGNIPSIVRSNFDMGRNMRGAYGAGMYFSEFPDVSIGYAQGANKLILCQLLPGRSYQCPGPMYNAPLQPGYDSHIVSADTQGRGQMVVIYDPDQILPTYVINY